MTHCLNNNAPTSFEWTRNYPDQSGAEFAIRFDGGMDVEMECQGEKMRMPIEEIEWFSEHLRTALGLIEENRSEAKTDTTE